MLTDSRDFLLRSPVEYNLFLDLSQQEVFEGMVTIKFKMVSLKDIYLDYTGPTVLEMTVNGKPVELKNGRIVEDGRIWIMKELLAPVKDNDVKVRFKGEFTEFEKGLFRGYQTSNEPYICTNGGPDATRAIFPIFDRPEIRGHFTVKAILRTGWHAICLSEIPQTLPLTESSLSGLSDFERPLAAQKLIPGGSSLILCSFIRTTLALPPHIFSITASNFPQRKISSNPPLSIYHSISSTVPPDTIFTQTLETLSAFFLKHLPSLQYPFPRVSLYLLNNHQPTYFCAPNLVLSLPLDVSSLCRGIVKGLTLWAEIWVEEGIAAVIADLVMDTLKFAADFRLPSYSLFAMADRIWAAKCDSVKEISIPLYDMQTRCVSQLSQRFVRVKSMAALKCLETALGEERFWKLVNEFLKKAKWTGVYLEDFLEFAGDLSKDIDSRSRSLCAERWKEDWMLSPGINSLRVEWEDGCAVVVQDTVAEDQERFRVHFVSFAFLNSRAEIIGTKRFSIKAISRTKLSHELFGKATALIPNHNGQTFARVVLDPRSLDFLSKNLEKIPFKVSQLMVYESMHSMVLNSNIRPLDYCNIVLQNVTRSLPLEHQLKILMEFFWPICTRFLKGKEFSLALDGLFGHCLKLMETNRLVSGFKVFLTKTCSTKKNFDRLFEALDNMDKEKEELVEMYMMVIIKSSECSEIDDDDLTNKFTEFSQWAVKVDENALNKLNGCLDFMTYSSAEKRQTIFECLTDDEKGHMLQNYIWVIINTSEYVVEEEIPSLCVWYANILPKNFDLMFRYLNKDLVPKSASPQQILTCFEGLKEEIEFSTQESKADFFELLADLRNGVEHMEMNKVLKSERTEMEE